MYLMQDYDEGEEGDDDEDGEGDAAAYEPGVELIVVSAFRWSSADWSV